MRLQRQPPRRAGSSAPSRRTVPVTIHSPSTRLTLLCAHRCRSVPCRCCNCCRLTADLGVANAELKLLRRARLKEMLEAEHQQSVDTSHSDHPPRSLATVWTAYRDRTRYRRCAMRCDAM